jgi:hypothetical protein
MLSMAVIGHVVAVAIMKVGGSSTHNNGTANHNIGPSGGNSTGGCITDGGYTLFRTII